MLAWECILLACGMIGGTRESMKIYARIVIYFLILLEDKQDLKCGGV